MTYEEYCEKRDGMGLTDNAVASLSGVSKSTLSQWKNGKLTPSKRTIARLMSFISTYDPTTMDLYNIGSEPSMTIYPKTPFYNPTCWVESFGVRVNHGHPIKLTNDQFDELRQAAEIFVDTYLRIKGILK